MDAGFDVQAGAADSRGRIRSPIPDHAAGSETAARGWAHGLRARVSAVVLPLLAALALFGSGQAIAAEPEKSANDAKQLKVVATIAMIADVARNVGGDKIQVTTLMGEGVDPHLYKATPGDVRTISSADVVLYNGLHLEGRMADVLVRMASRRTVVQVTDAIDESLLREPSEFDGHFDPHVWFNVSLWAKTADRIAGVFAEKDAANAAFYRENAAKYAAMLAELHERAKQAISTIPADRRLLVTAHDAFGYFGDAYGLEVLAIQGISTDSEASVAGINSLVSTLVSRKVPAVFIETSVPRKTIDALIEGCRSKGHEVKIGGELYSDAMGKPGTPGGTYIGMVTHNVRTIVTALGGDVSALDPKKKPEPAPATQTK
jgi:manganese/zinc/iron transport system substrate-binding protein